MRFDLNRFLVLILLSVFSLGQNQLKENLSHKTFSAIVIGISDGDTMEVLYKKTPIKIRLAHIDSPEKRGTQPFGNNAKQALSHLCFGQSVIIEAEKYDRYKRLIAVVINDRKQIVNQEMIKKEWPGIIKNIPAILFMQNWIAGIFFIVPGGGR